MTTAVVPGHGERKRYMKPHSCRCELCRAANSADMRKVRAAKPPVPKQGPPPHGASPRSARGRYAKRWGACRCLPCVNANRIYMAKYRAGQPKPEPQAPAPAKAPRPKPVVVVERNPDQMSHRQKDPVEGITLEEFKKARAAASAVHHVELRAA